MLKLVIIGRARTGLWISSNVTTQIAVALILVGCFISWGMFLVPVAFTVLVVIAIAALAFALLIPTGRVLESLFLTLPVWPITVMPTGVLSRLYVGNAIVAVLAGRWLLTPGAFKINLPHVGRPLTCVCLIAVSSLVASVVDPVSGIVYDYPHESVSRWMIVVTQLGLLTSLWVAPRIGARFAVAYDSERARISLYIGATLCSLVVIGSSVMGTSTTTILGHRRPDLDLYWIGLMVLPFMINDFCRGQRCRVWLAIGITLATLAVVLSFARQAWIFLLLAMCVPLLMNTRHKLLTFACISSAILLAGIVGAFDFYNPNAVYGLERTNYYVEALSLFSRHPLLGVGSGNYQFFSLADEGVMQGGIAHNQFLTALAESGVLIVPALAWLSFGIVIFARHVAPNYRPAVYGLVAGWFSSWFFSEMAIPTTAYGGNSHFTLYIFFIWLLIGILACEHRRSTSPIRQPWSTRTPNQPSTEANLTRMPSRQ